MNEIVTQDELDEQIKELKYLNTKKQLNEQKKVLLKLTLEYRTERFYIEQKIAFLKDLIKKGRKKKYENTRVG